MLSESVRCTFLQAASQSRKEMPILWFGNFSLADLPLESDYTGSTWDHSAGCPAFPGILVLLTLSPCARNY